MTEKPFSKAPLVWDPRICLRQESMGVSKRPLIRILLQNYRDANESHSVMQICGAYCTFCQEEGIFLQKYRNRNGRCIAILFESIRVRGLCDSCERSSAREQVGVRFLFHNALVGPEPLPRTVQAAAAVLRLAASVAQAQAEG